MKVLVALSAVLALGAAQYSPVGYPYYGYSPVSYYAAGAYNHYAPTVYSAAPAATVSSQYHAQDELGQFNYGYAGGPSAKNEFRRFDGATVGSYSYIDANGKVQTVSYTADDVNGFQVKATNLPVAPEANLQAPEFNLEAPVFDGVAPEPVQDTAEVAAAKAEFRKKAAEEEAAVAPAERRRRSAVLLPALAKATFKTATLDKVEADTPADTTLLKVTEKEHETYVPSVVSYAAPAVHYTAPVVSYAVPEVKKVEVKHVASPITYAASPLPLAYGLHPYGYGAPLIYNVEAKEETAAVEEAAEEEPAVVAAERRRRSAVLLPALAKATFKTATLDKVEADTPADTSLLKVTEKEHETYVPSVVPYAAPAVHYTAPVVSYAVPAVKKVEVKAAPITYAANAFAYAAPAITYTTPVVKKVEVKHVASPITYAASPLPLTYGLHPYGYGAPLIYNVEAKEESAAVEEAAEEEPAVVAAERRRRSAVLLPALAKATFKTTTLDKVEADTPADTTLLEVTEKEHETYVPSVVSYAAPAVHYTAPVVRYAVPEVKKVEVKTAPITYAASPLPLTYGLHPYSFGTPLIYNVEAKAAEVEEKAE
ncbi:uncharacterized protein LOC119095267 [Pollicipes pollicipes]|uniref:uncharacterized protein LOC119095267 n=1 Tax=Pollicipes pollicipes TaxID=41117 RepID=UPI001884D044|nr:uncharacterized protein LOC119095267 [Pollicipes pollicipes]